MKLKDMGWVSPPSDKEIDIQSVARIISVRKILCKAMTTKGELNVHLSGSFHISMRKGGNKPVTGDFIKIASSFVDVQNSEAAVLEEILPRRSKISRIASGHDTNEQVLVANVDIAFIVTSANDDFNLNRLQRYVFLAKEGNVTPVILLSKIDLIQDLQALVLQIKQHLSGVEIMYISSMEDIGIEKVQEKLSSGLTGVLLGSSGVGKSTLVNKLLDKQVQLTQAVRTEDSKGRHTTTSRELFFLSSGGMIIDTPGLRGVGVLAGEEVVTSTFKVILELLQNCKFNNCAHGSEPGCAIKEALKAGTLDQDKYDSYLKLKQDVAFKEKKELGSNQAKTKKEPNSKKYKARKERAGRK